MVKDEMSEVSRTLLSKVIPAFLKAYALRKEKNYQQAIGVYQQIINEGIETSELDQIIAYCYFDLGVETGDATNYSLAITWARKAIRLDPNDSQSFDILGEILSLGTLNYEEAAQAFRKSILLNPYNLHALVAAASLYGVPEQVVTLEEAISWLEQAALIDPGNPYHHLSLGMRYKEDRQDSNAESELFKALVHPRLMEVSVSRAVKKILGIDVQE